jgi:hypothetical protein
MNLILLALIAANRAAGRMLCRRNLHTLEVVGLDLLTVSCWHVIAVCNRPGCVAGLTCELHREACTCPSEVRA